MNGFFRSWTDSLIRDPFCEKLAVHMLRLYGFFPSWTETSFWRKECITNITIITFKMLISFINYTFRSCFVKSLAWLYLTKTYWETFLFCKNFSRKEVAQAYWILDLLNRNCCCISSIHRNKLIGVSNKFKQDFVVHLCISNS